MKILHIIPDFNPDCDGVSSALESMIAHPQPDISQELFSFSNSGKYQVADDRISAFGYSSNFRKRCKNLQPGEVDLIHIHGMWHYAGLTAAQAALRLKIPYVISPHGMLYPQALKISTWKKNLCRLLWFDRLLKNAAAVVVSCDEEARCYRALGFKNPVAVIPHSIDVLDFTPMPKQRRIGYLGRFCPYKNLPVLLDAWQKLNDPSAELLLMGYGTPQYETELKKTAARKNLKNVRWTGRVCGSEKYSLLSSCMATVLPSEFESFGMAVLESLAAGTPVIASEHTPWKELNSCVCGWHIPLEQLVGTLKEALAQNAEDISLRQQNGLSLIREKYNTEICCNKFSRFYRWLCKHDAIPDFVTEQL